MTNRNFLTSLITLVIISFYLAILAKYQKSLDINAIPWHDGSHHFTLAANLFNHMRAGDYSNWLEGVRNSPELIFAYTILNFAFAFLGGVKHEAIPLVYGFFFVLLVVIYSISYSLSGIKYFLHRHGFSYKQLIKFNSKSSVSSQDEFVNTFKEMNNAIENTDSILFLDAVHPQHNSSNTKAWIETGKEKYIECNTGRARLNLNGAYDPINNNVITVEGEKIDSENTIKLFQKIESAYPDKKRIYAFADNAKYYKSKTVKTFLETSRIILIHIPPYCPNLNLIERLWKFMRKKVINTKYFQKFTDFKNAILDFFDNIDSYASELKKFIGLKMRSFNQIYPKTNLA